MPPCPPPPLATLMCTAADILLLTLKSILTLPAIDLCGLYIILFYSQLLQDFRINPVEIYIGSLGRIKISNRIVKNFMKIGLNLDKKDRPIKL